jgi:uncharacterized protein YbjT (DUF2867 family)
MTILVTGATGGQGGSVARHLLNAGFQVRALTRNPDSDKATALADAGAQVVAGDLADRSSLDRALNDCDGVFGVTNFWEHFTAEEEHGTNLIEAVAGAGVDFFVFSTLPAMYELSGHELSVPHADIKAKLEQRARETDVPTAFVSVAFYYENFLSFFPPQRQDDGSYAFGFPQGDTPLAAVSVDDLGGVVVPMFENAEAYAGKLVGVVGDDLPPAEYADIMSAVLQQRVVYHHIPREVFAAFEFPGADDLANMFDFNSRFIPNRQADLEQSRSMFPAIRTFQTWLEGNREKFTGTFA